MNTRTIRLGLSVTVSLMLASCALPQAPRAGSLPVTVPERFAREGGTEPVDRWWEGFGDAGLNAAMEQVLSGNLDLRLAWARLDESRAVARRAGADLWPQVSASANGSRSRYEVEGDGLVDDFITRVNEFDVGLSTSYEVDLWGRIRSSADAAAAEARASREDVEAAALALAAAVAEAWFALAEQLAQEALLTEQITVSKTFLDLAEVRFGQGQGSALDVYQQRTQLAAVQGQLPLVAARMAVLRHELSVLAGRPPQGEMQDPEAALPALTEPPATGLPAQLLQQRPDVRAAYQRLAAADARTATAAAALLPRLRLTATGGYQSTEFHELFNQTMWSLAAGLTAPLFEGGRLRANVEQAAATARARLMEYGQVVLRALREVEDALAQESRQHEFLASLDQQLELAQATLEQAELRYRNGLSDYLPVLTALQSLQSLERERLSAQRLLAAYRVRLYRALGGTWTASLERPSAPPEP